MRLEYIKIYLGSLERLSGKILNGKEEMVRENNMTQIKYITNSYHKHQNLVLNQFGTSLRLGIDG